MIVSSAVFGIQGGKPQVSIVGANRGQTRQRPAAEILGQGLVGFIGGSNAAGSPDRLGASGIRFEEKTNWLGNVFLPIDARPNG